LFSKYQTAKEELYAGSDEDKDSCRSVYGWGGRFAQKWPYSDRKVVEYYQDWKQAIHGVFERSLLPEAGGGHVAQLTWLQASHFM